MHLIIFDIDGTIIDSVKTDDECFIQSFQDLFNIDLRSADWTNFKNVTDSGLTAEIFKIHLNREPEEQEIHKLKNHFYRLLSDRSKEISEIPGAINMLKYLHAQPNISVAFATGGWKETAELKLSTIGFERGDIVLTSANQDISRSIITQLAIKETQVKQKLASFDSITYVGDGIWDFQTTKALGFNFIGIDFHQNNKLINAGAERIINDFTDLEQIIKWSIG